MTTVFVLQKKTSKFITTTNKRKSKQLTKKYIQNQTQLKINRKQIIDRKINISASEANTKFNKNKSKFDKQTNY